MRSAARKGNPHGSLAVMVRTRAWQVSTKRYLSETTLALVSPDQLRRPIRRNPSRDHGMVKTLRASGENARSTHTTPWVTTIRVCPTRWRERRRDKCRWYSRSKRSLGRHGSSPHQAVANGHPVSLARRSFSAFPRCGAASAGNGGGRHDLTGVSAACRPGFGPDEFLYCPEPVE